MSDITTSVSDPTIDDACTDDAWADGVYTDDDLMTDDVPGEDPFSDGVFDADEAADDPVAELVAARGRHRRDQRGMATAEYAVGTVAAVALVTALINVFRNKDFLDLLLQLVMAIFKAVMASKGLGI